MINKDTNTEYDLLSQDADFSSSEKKLLGRKYFELNLHTAEGLQQFRTIYLKVKSITKIADAYNVTRATVYKWLNNDIRLKKTIELSEGAHYSESTLDLIAVTLLKTALGYDYYEVTESLTDSGELEVTSRKSKHVKADLPYLYKLLVLFRGPHSNPDRVFYEISDILALSQQNGGTSMEILAEIKKIVENNTTTLKTPNLLGEVSD